MKKQIIMLLFFILVLSSLAYTQDNVIVHYFYGKECPHCAKSTPFLKELEYKYPELNVIYYESWHNKSNAELLAAKGQEYDLTTVAVPAFFIEDQSIIGFDSYETTGIEIEKLIKACIEGNCSLAEPLEGNISYCDEPGKQEPTENLTPCPRQEDKDSIVKLPIFGKIDTSKMSLVVFTIILGILDGFNPCSMWVLLFLLTLLVLTGSRKKMLFVGGLFIFVSAVGYFLFMTAWLNFFLYIGFFWWMRFLVGSAAIIAGIINMKEMFFFKKGPSLSITDKHKARLVKKMHSIVHEATIPAIIIGIASLALTVNFVEFLCTAGFPAIFTKILTMNNLNLIQHYGYILLYIIMYELDDFIVLGIALIFFSRKTLTKTQGKWMKFIAGFMMFILGALLMFKPEVLMFG